MAEQTFRSPGFFEREIEVPAPKAIKTFKTSAAIIGAAEKGPAFVPVTLSNNEFINKFGNIDKNMPAGYAVAEYFRNNPDGNVTFMRVLGGGDNVTSPNQYENTSIVDKAGFFVSGALEAADANRGKGTVYFIAAQHAVDAKEYATLGVINDSDSLTTNLDSLGAPDTGDDLNVELIRGMVFLASGSNLKIKATAEALSTADTDDFAQATNDSNKQFDLVLESGNTKRDIFTVSLDPSNPNYISNVLNTDPFLFNSKDHLLYADFPVDDAVASTKNKNACVLFGNNVAPTTGGDTTNKYYNLYGRFETRYNFAKTTNFISQPYGSKEYDLFHLEALDDGSHASGKYKVSISNLQASTDPNYEFGRFNVILRDLNDTDENQIVLETFSNCNLDPNSDKFIAKVIGDKRISYNWDAEEDEEKRIVVDGSYDNNSTYVRVVVNNDVYQGEVPDDALPFGFRGLPLLKTTSNGKDGMNLTAQTSFLNGNASGDNVLFHTSPTTDQDQAGKLAFSVLPPLPYRFKVTSGKMTDSDDAVSQTYIGKVVGEETVKSSFYWGVMNTRVNSITNPNARGKLGLNKLINNYSKYLGLHKLATVFDENSTEADDFNNNKFTLARVAFAASDLESLSDPYTDHKEAVYIRNAVLGRKVVADESGPSISTSNYKINLLGSSEPGTDEDQSSDSHDVRMSYASLLNEDKVKFNKQSDFTKFTCIFYGGFDGVNILDKDSSYLNDISVSNHTHNSEKIGKAQAYESGLANTNDGSLQGTDLNNNIINSYRHAVRLMTEPVNVDHNILAIPGIRRDLITDFAAERTKSYGKSIFIMDIPSVAESGRHLFGTTIDGSEVPDVTSTINTLKARNIDNNYVSTYFPDVIMVDSGDDATFQNPLLTRVPSSVPVVGALAGIDRTNQPWFAPAGFNRGGLSEVRATTMRLNSEDRNDLYDSRINPIANFPGGDFVIFGQKTMQVAETALDRVNVRRLMNNIKRKISLAAQRLLFEQNDAATRKRFINDATSILSFVKNGQGIEDFRVIMDDSNNTLEDVNNNRMNGRIIVVPTRAVEFIAMDFIVTNSGAEFI